MPSNIGPILSICIPTYNRGSLLFHCLKSITEQEIFQNSHEIEIVVSDNASEDGTSHVVDFFRRQYPDKIRYHRNETNIRDRNFEKALSLGRGSYLKLVSDTFLFKKDGLTAMLDTVKAHQHNRSILCFTNDISRGADLICSSLDQFVAAASYITTWIGAFGIWRADFEKLDDFSHYAERQLAQTEIVLKAVAEHKQAVIINANFCDIQHVWSKGGYNIAEVFGYNYLSLLEHYVSTGEISKSTYKAEKRKILKRHILRYYYSRRKSFTRNGLWKHLKHFYWNDPYAYLLILWFFTRFQLDIRRFPIFGKLAYNKLWRKYNKHNSTSANNTFPGNEVVVGKKSSGCLNISIMHPGREHVIIGNSVSISENVRFISNEIDIEEGSQRVVIIDDDVSVGRNTTIFFGVTIGKGAIIGDNAVIKHDVEPYSNLSLSNVNLKE